MKRPSSALCTLAALLAVPLAIAAGENPPAATGLETSAMPANPPATWLTYHLAHPGTAPIPGDPNCAFYWQRRYHLHYTAVMLPLAPLAAQSAKAPFQPEWDSLKKHQTSEWYLDAKFGIYAHWGGYCVPAFINEWYPRGIYVKDSAEYKHHLSTYGDPSTRARQGELWREGDDLRFTKSKDGKHVYAISLKWPGESLHLKTVRPREGSESRLLGFPEPLKWTWDTNAKALAIELPKTLQEDAKRPCSHAFVVTITE